MKYTEITLKDRDAVLSLYEDAGWISYTQHIDVLMAGIEASMYCLGAWVNGELAGLIRCVGDGYTIVFIQDLLVKKKFKRQGIAKCLMNDVFVRYEHVRQISLNTDDSDESNAFYIKMGLKDIRTVQGCCYIR